MTVFITHALSLFRVTGTGKTFTLLSLAHSWRSKATCYTVIYKHDLLEPFRHVAHRYTVAKLVMETLSLSYFQYQALEMQLCGRLSGVEFIGAVIALLRRAQLPNMLGSLVILDEYTVVPKPLLLLILILLKVHRIGTIVCGDRNQLQNIHNSTHTRVSSYELARRLADVTFTLDINERCSDSRYNRIIDYVAGYSSDRRIDDFACSLVAAIFPRQLLGRSEYADTHLAATHRELAHVVHNMVVNDNIATSFYYIEPSASSRGEQDRILPNGLLVPRLVARYVHDRAPDKFLPYLPLCVGARYYLFSHSETTQATLRGVEQNELLFELYDDGGGGKNGDKWLRVRKCANNNVVFEPHRLELLGEDRGRIYNYPVYPTNIMTVHKCQGCTIRTKLDLHLANVTHQGLYVALSRVRDPRQIVRVTMPNAIAHLCSVIVNFPELCEIDTEQRQLDVDTLADRLSANYILYQPSHDIACHATLIADFFESGVTTSRKREIRRALIELLMSRRCAQRIVLSARPPDESTGTTLLLFLKHRDVFVSLACLEDVDRAVWLHEYVRCMPDLMSHMSTTESRSSASENGTGGLGNVLASVAGLNNSYPMSRSTLEYLRSRAKQEIRLLQPGADRDAQQRRVLRYEGDDDYLVVLAGSEFQARIYHKLASTGDRVLEREWLLAELDSLVAAASERAKLEPEKHERGALKRKRECENFSAERTATLVTDWRAQSREIDTRFVAATPKKRSRKINQTPRSS